MLRRRRGVDNPGFFGSNEKGTHKSRKFYKTIQANELIYAINSFSRKFLRVLTLQPERFSSGRYYLHCLIKTATNWLSATKLDALDLIKEIGRTA
jgi:hypothetical protein